MIDEYPSEEDIKRFSKTTMTCPNCHEEFYDDFEYCPRCDALIKNLINNQRGIFQKNLIKKIGIIIMILMLLLFLW